MHNISPPERLMPRQDSVDFRSLEIFRVLAGRWKMIVGISISATVVATVAALLLPDIYTAKAKILPPQQQSGLLSSAMMQGALATIGSELLGESKNAKLYAEMLKIESVRDPLIDRLKLHEVYGKKFREDVYKVMDRNILVSSTKEGIISINVDDSDAKRAAEIANGLVSELRKLSVNMSISLAGNNKSFLEQRIVKSKADLTDSENELKAFQSKYKAIDATQQAALSVSAISQMTAQLNSQEVELSILRRTYADSSQKIKTLQQSIKVLKEKIARLQTDGNSVALPGFEKIPERGQEYLHLMRKFKTAEAVYEMLVKQYELARLNAENDVSSIQVLQSAKVPDKSSKPRRLFIVAMTTFSAFLFSAVYALYLEYFPYVSISGKTR